MDKGECSKLKILSQLHGWSRVIRALQGPLASHLFEEAHTGRCAMCRMRQFSHPRSSAARRAAAPCQAARMPASRFATLAPALRQSTAASRRSLPAATAAASAPNSPASACHAQIHACFWHDPLLASVCNCTVIHTSSIGSNSLACDRDHDAEERMLSKMPHKHHVGVGSDGRCLM